MPGAVAALDRLGARPAGAPFRGIAYVGPDHVARHAFRAGPGLGVRRTELQAASVPAGRRARRRARRGSGGGDRPGRRGRPRMRAHGELAAGVRRPALPDPAAARPGSVRPIRGGRRFGQRRHVAMAPWSDYVEVHWSPLAEAYVTPVGPDLVGVAVLAAGGASYDELLAAGARPCANGWPVRTGSRRCGAPARCSSRVRRRVAGRVLLVGDAAGYVDALTGEGIRTGLACAEAAVAAVAMAESGSVRTGLAPPHPKLPRARPRGSLLSTRPADRAPPHRVGRRSSAAGLRTGGRVARRLTRHRPVHLTLTGRRTGVRVRSMSHSESPDPTESFRAARDLLLDLRADYARARAEYRAPRPDTLQLGPRLVRPDRRRRADRSRLALRVARAGRLGGRHDLRRALGPIQPAGRLAPVPRRRPRRPTTPDARQPARALGDAARLHQAGRRRHPRLDPAHAGRPAGPGAPWACATRHRARGGRHQVHRRPWRLDPDRGRRHPRGLARLRRLARAPASRSRPRCRPAPTRRCCSTSPRARRPSPSWSSTPTRRTRSGT